MRNENFVILTVPIERKQYDELRKLAFKRKYSIDSLVKDAIKHYIFDCKRTY